MARRKSKKNKFNEKLLSLLILIIGVCATVFLFSKAFLVEKEQIEGLAFLIGAEESFIIGKVKINFNLYIVTAILLPSIAGIIQIVSKEKITTIISLILFILSIYLLLNLKQIEVTFNILGYEKKEMLEASLSTLGIIGLIINGIGALFSGFKVSLK